MKNIIKSYLGNKRGMTLVEVLTAMAILSLIIFCFSPLFLTYFDAIKIAGDEVKDVQMQSGILQTVIGNFDVGKGGNYSANVTDIALELTTPSSATLSRTNNSGSTVSANMNGAVTVAIGNQIDDVKGDFLVSDPTNPGRGYTTIKAQGSSSGLVCYPKSLTDDFIEAKIIIYGSGGINFADASYTSDFKLSCGLNGGTSLANGTDYTVRKLASSMVEFTIYGGGKISFETSPLLINYKNGQHILQVEVDAPSMIMVGEADDNGDYYYYVSRGEMVDGADSDTKEDELAIIRRRMYTRKDQKDASISTSNPITLTSAMNDVEWVPADSGDGSNVMPDGQKYGYYVMCGDNGQVRRFWRDNTTGNYYWGGDETYYTDYNLNRFSNGTYIYTKDKNNNASSSKVYSTDTSFKYIAMRPMYWSEGNTPDGNAANAQDRKFRTGFNMSSKRYKVGIVTIGIAHLRNLCTVSATYGDDVQFYASDGLAYTYVPKKSDDSGNTPNYNTVITFQNSSGKYNGHDVEATSDEGLTIFSNEAWGWMDPSVKNSNGGMNSYYKAYGLTDSSGNPTVDTKSYPITLTSVDAIRINGTGGVYESNVTDPGKSHYFTSGVLKDTDTSGDSTVGSNASNARTTATNLTYPMSNYNLYCGYIPAYMDAWGGVTGNASYPYATTFGGKGAQYAKEWDSGANRSIGEYSNVGRASNRPYLSDNAEYNTIWRMTMGIVPIYNGSGLKWDKTAQGKVAYQYRTGTIFGYWYPQVLYYPYTNLEYAITGKYYDVNTYNNNRNKINAMFPGVANGLTIGSPTLLTSPANDRLNHTTNGKIIDITISYLSHPLAISIAANPTDDVVFDYSNNKEGGQVFYWHNRRESITFLDSASTVIPNGENDVPVSLMVGYVLGGTVMYGKTDDVASVDVTSVMNNGIVFLRAGNSDIGMQGTKSDDILESFSEDAANSKTSEYMATDKDGYKLAQESNVFHQFYYLNSRTTDSSNPSKGNHIGHIKGAKYWENNRHIIQRSITGPAPSQGNDGNYEYLRAHPMTDTKVNCVAWGVTWQGYPEAMWGTENGTVLSWWVDTTKAASDSNASNWNDRSVEAEFQSYKWVDVVNGKTYAHQSDGNYIDSIGSAVWASKSNAATTFSVGSDNYKYFYDKTSQETSMWSSIGFISTLETINDIEYSNDYWVAVGDQSDKDPADYCPGGNYYGGGETARAFSGNGRGGSWVNVRYWVNTGGVDAKQSDTNAYYHWRAVKISNNENYNIVQINNLNGIWIATGYEDSNNNEEYDNGERTVVCWARNPLGSCDEYMDGKWSEKVQFYANNGTNMTLLDQNKVGGINSCATRTE